MTDLVLCDVHQGLATLTLNRPEKLNALTAGVFEALERHISWLEGAPVQVQVVVLRGAGPCFSAGHDLGDIAGGEAVAPQFQSRIIERLANLPMPIVGAVHGHCYTGALELVLAADLIVAAESAKFADTHARWALSPVWGLSQRLPRRVGLPKAREMMFTCRTYDGRQAAEMGLADTWAPDAGFEDAVAALCAEIAANSPFSHAANKRLLADTDGLPLAVGLAHEVHRCEGVGPDARARIEAFAARRRV